MADILRSQSQWPSLAQDIALLSIPNSPVVGGIEGICHSYHLTRAELKEILAVPFFQHLLDVSMQEVQKQGSKAGSRYRALFLAQALAEKLFRKANADEMKDADMLKLLESLLKTAGLADKDQTTQVNVQNNIALPFPQGVSKVAHCIPAVEG